MPSYEYSCEPCEARQVETFSISVELPVPNCPKCGEPMIRVYSSPVVQFKGDGWGKDPN